MCLWCVVCCAHLACVSCAHLACVSCAHLACVLVRVPIWHCVVRPFGVCVVRPFGVSFGDSQGCPSRTDPCWLPVWSPATVRKQLFVDVCCLQLIQLPAAAAVREQLFGDVCCSQLSQLLSSHVARRDARSSPLAFVVVSPRGPPMRPLTRSSFPLPALRRPARPCSCGWCGGWCG